MYDMQSLYDLFQQWFILHHFASIHLATLFVHLYSLCVRWPHCMGLNILDMVLLLLCWKHLTCWVSNLDLAWKYGILEWQALTALPMTSIVSGNQSIGEMVKAKTTSKKLTYDIGEKLLVCLLYTTTTSGYNYYQEQISWYRGLILQNYKWLVAWL